MKSKKLCIFLTVIILTFTIVTLFTAGCKEKEPPAEEIVAEEPEQEEEDDIIDTRLLSPYTGTHVDGVFLTPICVLIENHPSARPQSGLSSADLIYEIPVEGGYTRFLAIYDSPFEGRIGPVRSARPYFVYLVEEHEGILAHCGNSIHTEEVFRAVKSKHIDEIFNAPYFQRDNSRKAPHNLYTDLSLLFRGAKDKGFLPSEEEIASKTIQPYFTFQPPEEQSDEATKIEIFFSNENYVDYILDDEGGYTRYNNGKLFIEAETGEAITVKNIIVQFVEAQSFTSEGHLRIKQVGEGKGLFFTAGSIEEITWEKKNNTSKTVFKGENGDLILAPGQTWIHLLPLYGKIDWSSNNESVQ